MTILAYRGYSTGTGTTSVTIPVPTGTVDGDGLALAILNDGGPFGWSGFISGWTDRALASGATFRAWSKTWHTGDPTSVTVSIPPATAISALMYGFEDGIGGGGIGSFPSGGTDVTKIQCPGGTNPVYLAFGGIRNATTPQTTPLTGDGALEQVVNVGNGPVWLVGGWDTANTTASRFFSGVTSSSSSRSGLGMRMNVDTTMAPVGGWGVGMVRIGGN